jgi:hypothetical protein
MLKVKEYIFLNKNNESMCSHILIINWTSSVHIRTMYIYIKEISKKKNKTDFSQTACCEMIHLNNDIYPQT